MFGLGKTLYTSKSLIISTGATAKYLGLENEQKYIGRGVSACATCDGAFFRDQVCCIVGGGDTAMEEALFLTRFAKKVYVIHRRDQFRASKIMADRVLRHEKIEVLWNTQLIDVLADKVVKGIRLKNTKTGEENEMEIDGVFIAIGHKPNTELFQGQLEMDSVGYLVTSKTSTHTAVEGIFACGDVQDSVYRQAITAAGTGCMAAMDCERWLKDREEA